MTICGFTRMNLLLYFFNYSNSFYKLPWKFMCIVALRREDFHMKAAIPQKWSRAQTFKVVDTARTSWILFAKREVRYRDVNLSVFTFSFFVIRKPISSTEEIWRSSSLCASPLLILDPRFLGRLHKTLNPPYLDAENIFIFSNFNFFLNWFKNTHTDSRLSHPPLSLRLEITFVHKRLWRYEHCQYSILGEIKLHLWSLNNSTFFVIKYQKYFVPYKKIAFGSRGFTKVFTSHDRVSRPKTIIDTIKVTIALFSWLRSNRRI